MEKSHPEYQYLGLLEDIMKTGFEKEDYATKIKLKSKFGAQIRFDLSQGFPLLTTKKMFTRGITHELVWFLRGETNIKYLVDNDVNIWNGWAIKEYSKATEKGLVEKLSPQEFIQKIKELPAQHPFVQKWGDLGPIYGRQWRKWKASTGKTIDQLKWAIWKTKNYPDRKHVCISAWNPEDIYEMSNGNSTMAIPPCHTLYNINVTDGRLSLGLYQRSADMFLGVPFNIASYAMLTQTLAQICGYKPGEFVHTLGDYHIYGNHFEQVNEQLSRTPKPFPRLVINPELKEIDDIKFEDFKVENYDSHPTLKGDLTIVGGYDEKERGAYNKK
jgi:thymidylate synthase